MVGYERGRSLRLVMPSRGIFSPEEQPALVPEKQKKAPETENPEQAKSQTWAAREGPRPEHGSKNTLAHA